ncbi:MAG TPA: TMEM175 family protein [Bryobacteraceae bacterium]|nr:TMEM175 family protein [Bryobacteraceae bacterium]
MSAKSISTFEPARLVSLSDGVFSIVLTLLVVTLQPPTTSGRDLAADLLDALPRLEAWVVSFVVVGSFWILHHNVVGLIERTDTTFNYLNLLLLMFLSIVPWTSALLGSYPDALAVVVFSAMLGLAGLTLTLQWIYATGRAALVSHRLSEHVRRAVLLLLARVPLVAVLSIAIAYFNRSLGLRIWLLVAVLGAIIWGRRRLFHDAKAQAVVRL